MTSTIHTLVCFSLSTPASEGVTGRTTLVDAEQSVCPGLHLYHTLSYLYPVHIAYPNIIPTQRVVGVAQRYVNIPWTIRESIPSWVSQGIDNIACTCTIA